MTKSCLWKSGYVARARKNHGDQLVLLGLLTDYTREIALIISIGP